MKPLNLRFKGINSFSDYTEIDFQALTRNGLFGIFGDTGSGKSTILDCINFALYGSVERSKEKADIINYRSESAEVKFTFDISTDGRRKSYTIERSIRKNKYGTHRAMMYERDGADEVCIADNASSVENKVIEVLGVKEEDFRKCIALPQGEFSQFVKSRPADRLALIERLFGLSKYGDRLKEKISAKQNQIESEWQNVSGRLSGYEEITEEGLKALELQLADAEKQLTAVKKSAQAAEERYLKIKNLSDKKRELDKINAEIAALADKKAEMENLRVNLQALPKCKEAVEVSEQLLSINGKIETLDKEIETVVKKIEMEEKNFNQYLQREKNENYEGKIAELNRLSALYSTASGKPEKLSKLNEELLAKREEYKSAEEKKKQLSAEKLSAEKKVAEAEKRLASLKCGDLESFVNVEFKGAVLRGEYVDQLDYFSGLYGSVTDFDDDTRLYKFISAELKSRIEDYKDRVRSVKDFRLDNVSERLKVLLSQSEEREKILEVLNGARRELTNCSARLDIKENELQTLKRDGAELRARADELEKELKDIFGGSVNYTQAVKDNESSLKRLNESKSELSSLSEGCRTRLSELKIELERKQTLKQTAASECKDVSSKLEKLIAATGYSVLAECKKLADSFENVSSAENALDEYYKKVNSFNEKREDLQALDGINSVTEKMLEDSEADKKALDEKVIGLNSEIAVIKSNISALKQKISEKAEIMKDFRRIESEKTLVARLKEVIKGNKFMEYIADEYLYDISSLASSTLLKLTDGRYFLTYKDNSFSVGDNFDCGNLRGVNTLSGGETFLVSLSLALALSQTICSRSMKSIEFFFLDEGFGTLDASLVETVMNALEKLKSSSFTIGVISHVEELKHRIDSKITVIKATENCGSKVQLSC